MYKMCYRGVSKDWDACASRFVQLVREEMSRKNATEGSRLLELCWLVARIICVCMLNIRVVFQNINKTSVSVIIAQTSEHHAFIS